jgi:hypothetical protein
MRTDEPGADRSHELLDAPVDRIHCFPRGEAAADAALIRDDGCPDAGRTQTRKRLASPRNRLDASRIVVVGDVSDERPVPIEEHRLGDRSFDEPVGAQKAREPVV